MTVTEERPATAESPAGEVGKARKRKEDARLITGRTTWTDNLVLPGMLHLAIVRSPVAHAKITNVDLSAAQASPGVVAVFSGRDFAEEQGSIPCAWPVTPDMVNPGHPSIAVEEDAVAPDDFVVPPGQWLRGVVRDADNRPAAGVDVEVWALRDDGSSMLCGHGRTDHAGGYGLLVPARL